jgi:hypothetical protein
VETPKGAGKARAGGREIRFSIRRNDDINDFLTNASKSSKTVLIERRGNSRNDFKRGGDSRR